MSFQAYLSFQQLLVIVQVTKVVHWLDIDHCTSHSSHEVVHWLDVDQGAYSCFLFGICGKRSD